METRKPSKKVSTKSKKNRQRLDVYHHDTHFINKIKAFNIENFCRCCLSGGELVQMDTESQNGSLQLNMYQVISSIIPRIGEYPKICSPCILTLTIAFKFRHMCQKADEKLKEKYLEIANRIDPLGSESFVVKEEPIEEASEIHADVQNINEGLLNIEPMKGTHRTDGKLLYCDQCGAGFRHRRGLIRHFQLTKNYPKHTQAGFINCIQCPKMFHSPSGLTLHVRKYHKTEAVKLKCKIDKLKQSRALKTQVATQEVSQFMCQYCSKTYNDLSGIIYHQRTMHENMRYICEAKGCDRGYSTKQQWMDHQWDHRSYRPYECKNFFPDCNFHTKARRSFKYHLINSHSTFYVEAIHGYKEPKEDLLAKKNLQLKPYTAPISNPFQRQYHKSESKPDAELPLQCEHCRERFSTRFTLRYHIRRNHNTMDDPYCKICNKWFPSTMRLFEHAFSHKNERPYNCPECDFKTKRKMPFTYHLKDTHDIVYNEETHGYDKEFMQSVVESVLAPPIMKKVKNRGRKSLLDNKSLDTRKKKKNEKDIEVKSDTESAEETETTEKVANMV